MSTAAPVIIAVAIGRLDDTVGIVVARLAVGSHDLADGASG